MKDPEEYVRVEVLIPKSRVGDFYAWTSKFLSGEDDSRVLKAQPVSGDYGSWEEQQLASWELGTREERLHDARRFYRGVSPNAQRFLAYLLASDDATRTADEAAEALGFDNNRQLAGALNTFGKRAQVIGRYQPFRAQPVPGGNTIYHVPEPIADLFREALRSTE